MNLSSDNNIEESDFSLRKFSLLSQNARNENPGGFLELKVKMQKINRPLKPFWPVNSLLSPDTCQRVTCKHLKINTLKIEKNEKTVTVRVCYQEKSIAWPSMALFRACITL